MRIWLSKNSEVPVREQLAEQLKLGIISEDFKAGERLPSIRALATRLAIHPNTVNAAYKDLADMGWVEFRHGSGVYVRERVHLESGESFNLLDGMAADFLRRARSEGFSLSAIQESLRRVIEVQHVDGVAVIEPDEYLRDILMLEVAESVGCRIFGFHPREVLGNPSLLTGFAPAALITHGGLLSPLFNERQTCVWLALRSIPSTLTGQQRPGPDEMITLASHWDGFLKWGKTLLVAAGIHPDALSIVDAREADWTGRLNLSAFVVCDILTASKLPAEIPVRTYRFISDESLTELRGAVEDLRADDGM